VTFIAKRFVRFLNERGIAKLPLPRTAKEVARAALKRDYARPPVPVHGEEAG
jgi:hypothetical protein